MVIALVGRLGHPNKSSEGPGSYSLAESIVVHGINLDAIIHPNSFGPATASTTMRASLTGTN